ncbi:hypothetical protein N0V88_005059 [Collariella sp. IMI 366227]|nr:hypothetical protein N0V88_005059 [Collariella sp. IMI 366227]
MTSVDLQAVHDTLVAVAFEAGRMIMAANPSSFSTKANAVDIVTETDQAVERMVSARLRAAYPSFLFVGEETYQAGITKITTAPTFVVDPIDGTTNFVHAFPNACISLGLVVDRTPAVGVVYNPFQDLLFTGCKGRDAALNLCACAAGQLDMYWEGGCYAWDVAAGWCILNEAGGRIVSGNPGEWETALDSRVYLAVRGASSGQKELVEEFWDVIGDGKMDYKH